jgi:hypothetical protein
LRLCLLIAFLGTLLFLSCKEQKQQETVSEQNLLNEEMPVVEVYVCPSSCETGWSYYLEGKCELCHQNLIKKED